MKYEQISRCSSNLTMSTSMLFSSPERACGLTRVNIESPFVKVNLDSPSERERISLLSDYTPTSAAQWGTSNSFIKLFLHPKAPPPSAPT